MPSPLGASSFLGIFSIHPDIAVGAPPFVVKVAQNAKALVLLVLLYIFRNTLAVSFTPGIQLHSLGIFK